MVKEVTQGIKNTIIERVNLFTIIKGIIIAYIITVPTFIIFAFVLTYTSFPERYISTVVILTTMVSILLAGMLATRNVRSKGWLNGGVVGFIYILVLYILSSIVFKTFAIDRNVLSMTFIGIVTGAIGGIIGINYKQGSHSKVKGIKR